MNISFHLWFHGIGMLSELPEFTRTHRTQASRLRVGWVVVAYGSFPSLADIIL